MILLIFLTSAVLSATTSRVSIPIGTIFKKTAMEEMNDVLNAMGFAMDSHTSSNRSRDFVLKFYVDNIDTVDPYKLTKVICKQVSWYIHNNPTQGLQLRPCQFVTKYRKKQTDLMKPLIFNLCCIIVAIL